MRKRLLAVVLLIAIIISMVPNVAINVQARTTITSSANVSGADFTDNAELAKKLDAIFKGNASVYSNNPCKSVVNTALGTSNVHPDTATLYVGPYGGNALNSGWSCWIYANGVYYTLFGEALGNGAPGANSESLNISGTSSKKLTYENMQAWGVSEGVGAQIRVGSHSIVVLNYDSTYLTFIDGNGDGKGLVAVRKWTWAEVQGSTNTNGSVKYIVQPKRSYMDKVYPEGGAGYLSLCTPYLAYCTIQVSKTTTVKSLPCSKSTDAESTDIETASEGDFYTAIGLYKNTEGNLWYKVKAKTGDIGYIYAGDTLMGSNNVFQSTKDLTVTGVAAPTQLTQGDRFSIKGVIKTDYQRLTNVGAYVVNAKTGNIETGTVLEVDTTSYSLLNSDLDYAAEFNNLPVGEYKYYIVAGVRSYYALNATTCLTHSSNVVLYESTFSVVKDSSCSHSYSTAVTAPTCTKNGYTTYTCKSCGYSYTANTTTATGHSYGNWTTTTAATCTAGGVQKSTCSACGDVKTQTIPATGHIYTATVIDANCVEYAKTVYLCTECGHFYEEYVQGAYSDWSTEKPDGIAEELIESRTEYRYQTKEYATGATGTMDGWTLYDTTTQWGDYGNWSAWSANSVTASDTTKVETRTAYGYYYYKCSSCGAHMHGYGSCYTWAGGCGASTNSGDWHEVWSATSWDNAGLKDWYGTGKYYAYIDGELAFKWTSGGTKTQYRYCTREQETVYNFYRWSDWSDWSASAVEAGDDCNVQTRTVYRYVETGLGDHKYISIVTAPSCTEQGYTTYSCSVCGESYKSDYTAALSHSYSYAASKAPTASAAGTLTGTCSKCSGTATVTLPKLNTTDYTYKVTKEPSYSATGTGRYTWKTTTYGTFYFEVMLDKLTATLTKIEVATSPTKTVYELGESLNTAGLVLKLTYSDGAAKTVTTGFTTTGFDSASAGTKTVTVAYGGKTTTFAVTVKAAEVDKNAPQIVLENKTVVKGNTVTMNLELKNNPGFCALQIAFIYNTEYLTLTSVNNQVPSMVLTSGSAYVWDAAEDYSEDGTLAVLTFEVAENAPEGDYEIQVYFMGASNADFEEVEMTGVSGVLTVSSIVYGDANGDGKVTTVDLAMLRRYLAAMDPLTGVSTITVQAGADVNGDGSIGTVDLAMLRRYLAAMDPITGESTIVLGPR